MATKNKSVQNKKPQVTNVQIMNESENMPSTSMESSVDLFIVLDDNCSSVSTSPVGNRLIDLSAESPREKEQNYYKVLFESTIDGIFVVDAEMMRIVLANQTAAEMYGFDSAEDMVGVNPLKLVHPDDKDRVLRIMAQDVIHNNLRLIHKFRAITKDGRELWVRAVGTRTEYQGRLAGLISIRDISERKQAEEDKQRLEQRIEFESWLASVGELAAGVAHELNNPVAAVLAYAQLLMNRENLDETIKGGLEAIDREAQRAATIIDNLLLFARRHRPEKNLLSINQILERMLDICSHQMEFNSIEISAELDPDLPMTMADFDQMQQIFMNIINNAGHAMTEYHGQGRLSVRTQRVGQMIRITFTDDGPGIAEDDLGRIFDPFFTTKGTGKGTGLGLTIAYGLVEGHGGRIYAKSKLDKGATFVVELPLITDDQPINGQPDLIQVEKV